MESHEFKNVCIKNCRCYYFADIMKLEDFDIYNILLDEILHENILFYDISCKTLFGQ